MEDIIEKANSILKLAKRMKELDVNSYLKICHYNGNTLAEFEEILKKAIRKKEIKLGIYKGEKHHSNNI